MATYASNMYSSCIISVKWRWEDIQQIIFFIFSSLFSTNISLLLCKLVHKIIWFYHCVNGISCCHFEFAWDSCVIMDFTSYTLVVGRTAVCGDICSHNARRFACRHIHSFFLDLGEMYHPTVKYKCQSLMDMWINVHWKNNLKVGKKQYARR